MLQALNYSGPISSKESSKRLNILVMDDEEKIRGLYENLLRELGHEVDTAESGEDAIKKYKKSFGTDNPYNLLILDLTVLTGMGGKEALSKILEIDPEVKAIVCSGYSNDLVMSQHKSYGFIDVLPKPFTIERLKETLNKLDI